MNSRIFVMFAIGVLAVNVTVYNAATNTVINSIKLYFLR